MPSGDASSSHLKRIYSCDEQIALYQRCFMTILKYNVRKDDDQCVGSECNSGFHSTKQDAIGDKIRYLHSVHHVSTGCVS